MMLTKGFWEDEDVVDVHYDLSIVNLDSENFVHHGLESSGWIRKAKEHDSGFVETAIGSKGGLPFISFLYTDIVVTPTNVKFGKILSILKGCNGFLGNVA
jgi:hypothetical protein